MSVAFRRESDDEHLEPRFELPIPPGPNLVTERGFRLIEERVAALETAREDASDEESRKALARDLRYWRTRRATAEVTPPATGTAAGFGRTVRVRMAGLERILKIVGADEADGRRDAIAFTAPLARALSGAEAGEFVELPGQSAPIEVLEISALEGEYRL